MNNTPTFVRISKDAFLDALQSCFPSQWKVIPDWTLCCQSPDVASDYNCQIIGVQLVGETPTGVTFSRSMHYVGQGLDELLTTLDSKLKIGETLSRDGIGWRLADVWSGQPSQEGLPEVAAISDCTGFPPWRDVLLEYAEMKKMPPAGPAASV